MESIKEKLENILTIGVFYLLLIILALVLVGRYEELYETSSKESNIASVYNY